MFKDMVCENVVAEAMFATLGLLVMEENRKISKISRNHFKWVIFWILQLI